MKASIDGSLCTGCALCLDTCPEVFEMGDDNIARVKGTTVPAPAEQAVRDAASFCPVTCINVVE